MGRFEGVVGRIKGLFILREEKKMRKNRNGVLIAAAAFVYSCWRGVKREARALVGVMKTSFAWLGGEGRKGIQ